MIDYLYKLDFEYYNSEVTYNDSPFQLLDFYILADKYDIPGLRKWCRLAFKEEMYNAWWTSAKLLEFVDAAWNSLPSNDKGLLKNIFKECARYICENVRKMDASDQQLKHKGSASLVQESKEGLPTEQQDNSDGACWKIAPKPLSSIHWKHLLEDPDFTARLRQAMIRQFEDSSYAYPNYPWLLRSSFGRIEDFELTLKDLQRYLEMDPPRGY